jgi:hypothetical protein
MWDAILSSVPENTEVPAVATAVSPMKSGRLAGSYRFGDNVVIDGTERCAAAASAGRHWVFRLGEQSDQIDRHF